MSSRVNRGSNKWSTEVSRGSIGDKRVSAQVNIEKLLVECAACFVLCLLPLLNCMQCCKQSGDFAAVYLDLLNCVSSLTAGAPVIDVHAK